MNKISKGNILERRVKKILENDGWTVFRQHRRPIFIKGKIIMIGADIFGSDLLAKKKFHLTRWINVATIENKTARIKEFEKFPWNWDIDSVEVWCKVPKHGFRIFRGPSWKEI